MFLDVEIQNVEKNILLQLIHFMKNSQNKNYLLFQKSLNDFLYMTLMLIKHINLLQKKIILLYQNK